MAKFLLWLVNILFGVDNGPLVDPQSGYVLTIPTPTEMVENVEKILPTKKIIPTMLIEKNVGDTRPWGVAVQIDEHTWTMRVGMDKTMATPQEIFEALNEYRVRRGSQRLVMDEKLREYAQSRADYLASIKSTDGHRGFADFVEKENGYEKLGFTWLGENISYGYQLEGVHVIEWMYAGDKPHDDNQVNNRWNYVGIGVRGTATALIFATGKK